jgi:Family of unknown function (DUF6088)
MQSKTCHYLIKSVSLQNIVMANSTAEIVRRKIEKIEEGALFAYANFNFDKSGELSVAKALSRMAKEGTIVRFAKGKYYKPRDTVFGKLRPNESALVEALTFRNKQRIGYITGLSVYNRMGLTTQVPNTLTIATKKPLPSKVMESYRINYVKRTFDIREQDISLLQMLDAIRDIKSIPDSYPDNTLKILISRIKTLSEEERRQLVKLSLNYNASTRALMGAMMEKYFPRTPVDKLAGSLNRLSNYEIKISESTLPNKSTWNIK